MKFIVSDHIALPNKFGKWNFWHDKDIKIHESKDHIILYHGYVIDTERTLDDYVKAGWWPDDLNGNFSFVKFSKDSLDASVDQFSQNRIYWRDNEQGFSLTNRIYLLPFRNKDIILDKIERYREIQYEKDPQYTWYDFEQLFKLRGGIEQQPTPKDLSGKGYVHYSTDPSTCWRDTYNLVAGSVLHRSDKTTVKDLSQHDTLVKAGFNSRDKQFKTAEHLRDHVHDCMQSHADIIKSNYKNIVCSISEGIDSQTYDAYFPEARKITHTIKYAADEPFKGADIQTSADPKFKRQYLGQYDEGMVREDVFHVEQAGEIAARWSNDTEMKHWDVLPTYHQIMENDRDMDMFVFGQQADEMFMHNAVFYLTYVRGILHDSGLTMEQQFEKYKEYVRQLEGKYACKEVLYGDNFWDYRREYSVDSLENFKDTAGYFARWQDWFAYECMPTYYCREISHISDIPCTSMYADTRMYHAVRNTTHEVLLKNMSDAFTQKQILQDKFDREFKTPFKNGTYFNTAPLVASFVKKSLGYCLHDHIADINRDQWAEATMGRIK